MRIERLCPDDYAAWLPLWDANNKGQCPVDATAVTWERLMDDNQPVYGLCARDDNGIPAAIMHYVLHPTTGNIRPVCYMQDLFVDPDHRRRGMARALVNELARIGRREDWARIYWLADGTNEAAQNLYKTLGIKLNFSLHVLPLQ
ncbi:MAG: GNAT family N-acetyltransferase [Rhodospirillales bacterium]|nr:GNAT family N-acetyltransferase [Rhodospirillales bacterium]